MTQSATEKYSKQEHKLTDHTGWWIAAWVKVDIWSHLHTITYICSVCNVCPKDDMSLPWQWILPWWYWRWYSQSLAHLGPRLSAPHVCGRLEMEIKSVVSCLKKIPSGGPWAVKLEGFYRQKWVIFLQGRMFLYRFLFLFSGLWPSLRL